MTSAAALDSLASCGAIETVVVVLEVAQGAVKGDGFTKRLVPRRDELEDQLVPIVYYLCLRSIVQRLARAARCGAATPAGYMCCKTKAFETICSCHSV